MIPYDKIVDKLNLIYELKLSIFIVPDRETINDYGHHLNFRKFSNENSDKLKNRCHAARGKQRASLRPEVLRITCKTVTEMR